MQQCPICKASVNPSERYPSYVCVNCVQRAQDHLGRPVKFYNQSLSGGYQRSVMINHQEYIDEVHECFIDGIPCYADEAHMGGIVTQLKGSI